MRTAVVLILIAIFFVLALQSRVAALYTYYWFSIFRPQDWVWINIDSLRLPLIAFALVVIPTVLQGKLPRFNNAIAIYVLLLMLMAIVSTTLWGCADSGYVSKTKSLFDLGVLLFITLLTVELITDVKIIFRLVMIVSVSIAILSSKSGLHAMLTGANYQGVENLSGYMTDSNSQALISAMSAFFMMLVYQYVIYFESYEKKWIRHAVLGIKYGMLLAIFGGVYMIIALSSRGSFLALAAGFLIFLFLQQKRFKAISIIALLAAFTLPFVPLPDNFEERIQSAFVDKEELDASAASRPHFWKTAVRMVNDHPLGVGVGCYPVYYNYYDDSGGRSGYFRSVHSSHFQVLADIGYPGIFIWFLLHITITVKLLIVRKKSRLLADTEKGAFYFQLSNVLIVSNLVFLMGGSFYEFAYNELTWLTITLVISTVRVFEKDLERVKPANKGFKKY